MRKTRRPWTRSVGLIAFLVGMAGCPDTETAPTTDTETAADTTPASDTSPADTTTPPHEDTEATPKDTAMPPADTILPDVPEPGDVAPSDTLVNDTTTSPYKGGWPFNPNKDSHPDPGFEKCTDGVCIGFGSCNPDDKDVEGSDWQKPTGCSLKDGLPLPRWQAMDQYGELVDIYDFMGEGKPIVLDVATTTCDPCKSLAAFFSTGDTSTTTEHADFPLTSFGWWKPEYEVVLELINTDQIRWITIVWSPCIEDGPNPVAEAKVAGWHGEWPHPKIPVLADGDCKMMQYLNVSAMPHIVVLDENLVFTTYATNGPYKGMKALVELYENLSNP